MVSYLSTDKPQPLPTDPIQFDFAKHRLRLRRNTNNAHCQKNNSTRHVLFMLDTSASINQSEFENMTDSLGEMVLYFCQPVKIAAMVFNDQQHLKFCFNCFDNDCEGREKAKNAIQTIRYRAGLTHTAAATECACQHILQPKCGFHTSRNEVTCLDVVYITDGWSNDPKRNVCKVINCLKNFGNNTDVHVFVFGLGNITQANLKEIKCLGYVDYDSHGPLNIFANNLFKRVKFSEFSNAIRNVVGTLKNGTDDALRCITSNPQEDDIFNEGLSYQHCNYTSQPPT